MRRLRALAFFLFCLLVCGSARAQSVAPIQGLGSIQFLSNTGVPLTNGVLYSYQAGTTTQQATYTDATGTIQNPNPITFTIGGRAQIWLTIGSFYKFVLCVQNDGASCAPGDVIFSVDQVPGGSSGSGSGSSPFTGIFISGTASPATTGVLRLASNDSICWRNAAGTTNLCISKNGNDLLQWAGSSFGFNEIPTICAQAAPGLDLIWADNAAHRWMMSNNGGTCAQIVQQGNDINQSDAVVQVHFGATPVPLCGSTPVVSATLQWNGANACFTGGAPQQTVFNTTITEAAASVPPTTMVTSPAVDTNYLFQVNISQTVATAGCSANPTATVSVTYTDAATNASRTVAPLMSIASSVPSGQIAFQLGSLITYPSYGPVSLRAKASTSISYQVVYSAGTGCSTGATYFVAPVLVQQ